MYGYVFIAANECIKMVRQDARRWFPNGRSLKSWNRLTRTAVEVVDDLE